ncbi:hypothetical protein [Taklimakanibacter albus]|uniref:Uncharacterized protein n=1 Tax=Taklimakanibacter albus TaxID=2800327 RepID=A0ACC5RG17_9HYPH|nr:hypothetical protein [Aestuariivirga sp. YIM B02566]
MKGAKDRQEARGLAHGYRSGLEEKNAKFLEAKGIKVAFESIKIPYTVPEIKRRYTPDFPLPNGIIVETKGKLEPEDRAKHLFIKLQHPELDIRFVFQRPTDPIYKGSPTSYAQWCDKHGFKWATKLIPEAWILEPGPKKKPEEVLKR